MKRMPSVPWSGAPSVTGMSAKVMAMRSVDGDCAWAGRTKGRAALASRAARRVSMRNLRGFGRRSRNHAINGARTSRSAFMSGPGGPRSKTGRGMFLAVPSPTMAALNTLTATELAQKIDLGAATSEAIVRAHLERIDQRDADVLAWSHLAREAALERARLLDRGPRQGLLHGIPMGVNDIIASCDQPTTYGSPIYNTHHPPPAPPPLALPRP